MRRKRYRRRGEAGQVTLEYFLAAVVVVAVASLGWLFYQGFVLGNLYGGSALGGDIKALGLETVAALPFP